MVGENGPKISVFIPTLNRAESLKACLASLENQTYSNFEVVIVDGGSTDNTPEVIHEFTKRLPLVYRVKKGGLIPQANVGWQVSKGDIVSRIDDDVVVTPNWLKEVADTFADLTIGGVTGPTIIPKDKLDGRDLTYFNKKMQENPGLLFRLFSKIYYGYIMEGQPFATSRFFKSGAFSLGSNYEGCLNIRGLVPADHLEACNSSLRRELISRARGYDEKFVGIGEYHEPDLAFKVKKLGYRLVFNPKAILYHMPNVSGVFQARPFAYGRSQNFILFYFRHIKPNTIDKLLRFLTYLFVINSYWVFKFIITGKLSTLMGVVGTFVGIFKYLPELREQKTLRNENLCHT